LRRTASEVLHDLERRVARLEMTADDDSLSRLRGLAQRVLDKSPADRLREKAESARVRTDRRKAMEDWINQTIEEGIEKGKIRMTIMSDLANKLKGDQPWSWLEDSDWEYLAKYHRIPLKGSLPSYSVFDHFLKEHGLFVGG